MAWAEAQAGSREDRTLADLAPVQIWTAGPGGSLEYVNDVALNYLGRSPEQAVGGWEEVAHADDVAPYLEAWSRATETPAQLEVELRLRRADGEYRWYLMRAVPQRDEDGHVVHWVGMNADVDERKRAELRLYAQLGVARALAAPSVVAEAAPRVLRTLCEQLGWELGVLVR